MELLVQFCEGGGEHVAMAGIMSGFELLKDSFAGKTHAFELTDPCCLLSSQAWLELVLVVRGFGLLCFDRLTLPSSGHTGNYSELIGRRDVDQSAPINQACKLRSTLGGSDCKRVHGRYTKVSPTNVSRERTAGIPKMDSKVRKSLAVM